MIWRILLTVIVFAVLTVCLSTGTLLLGAGNDVATVVTLVGTVTGTATLAGLLFRDSGPIESPSERETE